MNALKHFFAHLRSREGRQSRKIFQNFFLILALILIVNSTLFHLIMAHEMNVLPDGRNHNLDNDAPTAIYWVLITMSTVGYGDITFETHLGQLFSIAVMLSGVIYLFIAGSYTPWSITYGRADVGLPLLGLIWLTALTGFVSKVVLRRHVNSVRLALYMLLAWIPVLPLRHLLDIVPVAAFAWLLIGGACYTVGTIFWKIDNKRYNFHAIWHVMVMLGELLQVKLKLAWLA